MDIKAMVKESVDSLITKEYIEKCVRERVEELVSESLKLPQMEIKEEEEEKPVPDSEFIKSCIKDSSLDIAIKDSGRFTEYEIIGDCICIRVHNSKKDPRHSTKYKDFMIIRINKANLEVENISIVSDRSEINETFTNESSDFDIRESFRYFRGFSIFGDLACKMLKNKTIFLEEIEG